MPLTQDVSLDAVQFSSVQGREQAPQLMAWSKGLRGAPSADTGAVEGLRAVLLVTIAAAGLPHFAGDVAGTEAAPRWSTFEWVRDRGVEGRGGREGEPITCRGGVPRRSGDESDTSVGCLRLCEHVVSRRGVA